MKEPRTSSKPMKPGLICDLPSLNDDPSCHAELIMNGADVVESTWRREGHAKAVDARRRLGQIWTILRRGRQKSGIHAVRRRGYNRLPRPIRGRRHIRRRRPGIIGFDAKSYGVVYR